MGSTIVALYYQKIAKAKLDMQCKDVGRLCFYSYDQDVYVNEMAKTFYSGSLDSPDLFLKSATNLLLPGKQAATTPATSLLLDDQQAATVLNSLLLPGKQTATAPETATNSLLLSKMEMIRPV